ncbi:MAG: folate-binding protein YgfZ [Halioglobus sp.]
MNANYCLLEQESLLHIVGPDSLTFLQGQTTCDTRLVDANRSVPGVYCTPQGRVVCDFMLAQLGHEHFAMRMRRAIRSASSTVFGKYIIFSKATLDDSRDDWVTIGLWGAEIRSALSELFDEVPAQQFTACSGDGYALLQTDEAGQHFECYLDAEHASGILKNIQDALSPSPESQWQAQQIAAGIARIEAETVEEFVPQILNYDFTGHLDFGKGCYTGQEVVARLHYRGKSKRRTFLAQLSIAEKLVAGTPVYTLGNEQSVGNVINSSIEGETIQLLVAATISGAAEGLYLHSADGEKLVIGDLPYSITSDEE